MKDSRDWTCVGEGGRHCVDLAHLETLSGGGSSTFTIEQCRRCLRLYRLQQYEINDWSETGDYCDTTHIWIPLDPDEIDAARADMNFTPRAPVAHRHDTGWRSQ